MRRPLVIGNWKMNGSIDSVTALVNDLEELLGDEETVAVAVCPPSVFIPQVAMQLGACNIAWGGQNLSEFAAGAYTGELSATMLKDFACRYVLVGHSERRTLMGETDAQVAAKTKMAADSGLIPVICVGETLAERRSEQTLAVIERQLAAIDAEVLGKCVVAYEPVWAIGTGETATPQQAQEVHAFIRSRLPETETQILYGGSVKPDNAAELFAQDDIDGGLIGGASLDAGDFTAIVEAAR